MQALGCAQHSLNLQCGQLWLNKSSTSAATTSTSLIRTYMLEGKQRFRSQKFSNCLHVKHGIPVLLHAFLVSTTSCTELWWRKHSEISLLDDNLSVLREILRDTRCTC